MIEHALDIFSRVVKPEFVESCRAGSKVVERAGIYESTIVVWLMIFQRLHPDGTVAKAVEDLRAGASQRLLERVAGSIRARTGRISSDTGGYAKARQRVPLQVVANASDALNSEVVKALSSEGFLDRIYIIDGTTIRLPHTKTIIEDYPQHGNQYGEAHFPLVRAAIAVHARSGAALRPSFGPYNGETAASELALADEVLSRVPGGSIVVGDRMFGCIRFVLEAQKHGLTSICRVKEKTSCSYIDDSVKGEKEVQWCSQRDKVGVAGRFIWKTIRRGEKEKPERLILFTDDMITPRDKIFQAYALRWNIELDLRSLKSTLGMAELSGKTSDVIAKELIRGVTAYNLVRLIMIQVGKRDKISIRELSFSRFLTRISALSGGIFARTFEDREYVQKQIAKAFSDLSGLRHPRRNKRRPNEPRKVLQRGTHSYLTSSRAEERAKLFQG